MFKPGLSLIETADADIGGQTLCLTLRDHDPDHAIGIDGIGVYATVAAAVHVADVTAAIDVILLRRRPVVPDLPPHFLVEGRGESEIVDTIPLSSLALVRGLLNRKLL